MSKRRAKVPRAHKLSRIQRVEAKLRNKATLDSVVAITAPERRSHRAVGVVVAIWLEPRPTSLKAYRASAAVKYANKARAITRTRPDDKPLVSNPSYPPGVALE